jgi:transcriptional regulator with XRE-family HTH domain
MKGKDFKKLLRDHGITQEIAAKKLGVSRQTVNTWCKIDEISQINDKDILLKLNIDSNKSSKEYEKEIHYDFLIQKIEYLENLIKSKDETISTQKDLIENLKKQLEEKICNNNLFQVKGQSATDVASIQKK